MIPNVVVELTAAQAVEVLRGLAYQRWSWDHIGARAIDRRTANAGAEQALIDAGAVRPAAGWEVISESDDARRCHAVGEHHPAARHPAPNCPLTTPKDPS